MRESQYTTSPLPIPVADVFIPEMIVSGGQSGADMGGLLAARACGIPTGGYAPRGWRTENGANPDLGRVFGLFEHTSENYDARTSENIKLSDVTIIIARRFDSPGTALTESLCRTVHYKPFFKVVYPTIPNLFDSEVILDVKHWLDMHAPAVVNIAGNRESKAHGIQEFTRDIVRQFFT